MVESSASGNWEPLVVTVSPERDGAAVECDLSQFEAVTRDWRFRCVSGEEIGDRWRGVPVSALLDAVSIPAATTHVVVEAADGFRGCFPLRDALDGVLAVADEDGRLESAPRFVSPGIDGPRTVKTVERLESVALDPEESPEAYEDRLLE